MHFGIQSAIDLYKTHKSNGFTAFMLYSKGKLKRRTAFG